MSVYRKRKSVATTQAKLYTFTKMARYDPTHTTQIRQQFEAELVRRFKALRSAIIEAVDYHDGFGLRKQIVANNQFAYARTDEKVSSFMRWVKQQEKRGVFGVMEGTDMSSAGNNAWTNTYMRRAYTRGVQNAANNLKRKGAKVSDRWVDSAFNRPIHADRAGLIFTRTFTELEGITNEMDKQISRVLAEGIIAGENPREIARSIADRVDKVGIARARVLARTEVIRAHHQANINSYKEAGVLGVKVIAEFSSADDDRVCPECEALDGKEYSLESAEALIPVHPQCRCTVIPEVLSVDGIELE